MVQYLDIKMLPIEEHIEANNVSNLFCAAHQYNVTNWRDVSMDLIAFDPHLVFNTSQTGESPCLSSDH